MLLSGNLNPPTVIFSLLEVPGDPPQAAASMVNTPSAATKVRNGDRLMLINPSTGRKGAEACNPGP